MIGAVGIGGAVRVLDTDRSVRRVAGNVASAGGSDGSGVAFVRRRRVTVIHRSSQPEPPSVGYREPDRSHGGYVRVAASPPLPSWGGDRPIYRQVW